MLVLLIIPFELGLSFLVLFQDRRSDYRNRLFFVFALSMVGFLITNYLADGLTDRLIATWDLRLYFVFTSILTSSIFLFSFVFPQNLNVRPLWRNLVIAYGVVASLLSLTPLIVKDVKVESWGSNVVGGPAFFPYNILNLVILVTLLIFLFVSYRRSKGTARSQAFFLFLGFFIFFVVNLVVNVVIPIITATNQLARYGSFASAFFVGFTAYAIVAHHLFDIRVIIRRTVVYTGLLAFALGTYSMVIYFFTALFGGQNNFDARSFVTNLIAAGFIAVGYEPLRIRLTEKTDSFLFKKEYEEQAVLSALTKQLNDVIALDEALEIMMQTIVKVLHLHHAVTFIFQPAENGEIGVKRIKQIGYSSMSHLYLNERDFTTKYFTSHPGIATLVNLQQELEVEKHKFNYISKKDVTKLPKDAGELIRQHAIKDSVVKKLKSLNASIAIPLHLSNQPVGLILLSEKLTGDAYSKEDITLLETIGSQAISSIQKAQLYEGDQMKSEFVSIASHELLTPVSAIEGYLSMILEEGMGKVDDQARGYLEKVYTSSKRLATPS